MTIRPGYNLAVAAVQCPLSPAWRSHASHGRGEGWGEGMDSYLDKVTSPSPGVDDGARKMFEFAGHAGLSPRGEAKQERAL